MVLGQFRPSPKKVHCGMDRHTCGASNIMGGERNTDRSNVTELWRRHKSDECLVYHKTSTELHPLVPQSRLVENEIRVNH